MEIIFATNNMNKVIELRAKLGDNIVIKSLSEIGFLEELEETQDTIEGNAQQKAEQLRDKLGVNCFSEDTGLEIEALNGEPGVYSARYAGEAKSAEANMDKVLELMADQTNRKARFKTVIWLILGASAHAFEGIVEGEILHEKQGVRGFGYDPIFKPHGYNCSFAEMKLEEKNKISHRGRATEKMITYLQNQHA